jgi:hypothetical protein
MRGNYATAINVHNPSLTATVTLFKNAVQAPYEQSPPQLIPPSGFQTYSLQPGYAVEVDCADIVGLLGGTIDAPLTFIKGFVTIVATGPLDVVGVYSSEPPVETATPLTIPGIGLELLPVIPRIEFAPNGVTTLAPAGSVGRIFEYSAKFLCGEAELI